MLGKGDKHVLYSKDDTLLPRFVRGLPSPEERGFPDGAALGQSGLLKAGNVDNQLEHSLSMIAVFIALLICCRSLGSSRHVVLTLHPRIFIEIF